MFVIWRVLDQYIKVVFCLFNSSCGGELLNMYMQFEYSLFVDMTSAREVLLLC